MKTDKVTRLEVIDNTGRLLVLYNCDVQLQLQDYGSTLKVFVNVINLEGEIPELTLEETKDKVVGTIFKYKEDKLRIDKFKNNGCSLCAFKNKPECGEDTCYSYARAYNDNVLYSKID